MRESGLMRGWVDGRDGLMGRWIDGKLGRWDARLKGWWVYERVV